MNTVNTNVKEIIAKNISFLLEIKNVSRREVCDALEIKYTTFCDWINEKSFPRIDSLVVLADYFGIEIQYFFVDIKENKELASRISEYVRRLNMKKDYSDTYPEGFFDLFGCLKDTDFNIPEDLPAEEVEEF